jgi:trehalose 6-phosphate synthase
MKITVRLVVSLVLVVGLAAVGFSFYQVRAERIRLRSELERRTILLAESIQESVTPLITSDSSKKLNLLVQRFSNRERFQGIVVHDARGQVLASTADLEGLIPGAAPQVVHVLTESRPAGGFLHVGNQRIYLYSSPLLQEEKPIGVLTLFHDASFIDIRLVEIWRDNLFRFLILSVLVVGITLIVVRWSITGPIAQMAGWIKELRTGKTKSVKPAVPKMDAALDPLISEVNRMAKSLAVARARAEEISSLNIRPESLWTAQRLKEQMRVELDGKKLVLVSNREPYIHERDGPVIRCIVPAGGLITALDPVMRACDGLWIAHGAGDADRETVDGNDTLRVPPKDPAYTLKRVWLTREEEDGYYYGFANEGLWPLCHITHTRPDFRLEDWTRYREVNEKFAEALLSEIAGEESPLILVQDYHLALLPSLIKEKRPDAKVAIFWHIPWPNPEAYGICPWRQEILQGMLGADIIGFHIQFHCNNFLETVDRFLESKIDWAQFSVTRAGHTTLLKPFPISVRFDPSFGGTSPEEWPAKEDLLRGDRGPGGISRGGSRPDRLYERDPRTVPGHRALLRKVPGIPGAVHLRGAGSPQPHPHQEVPRSDGGDRGNDRKDQLALPDENVEADHLPEGASHPRGDRSMVQGVRPLHGHLPARRNEPGLQGIRRRQGRRGRGADPEPVHRGFPRTEGRPRRQPVRHRADGRRHQPRAPDAARGKARQDGADARERPRLQHLPMGRKTDRRARAAAVAG